MVRFQMPTNAAEVLKLVVDANRLYEQKLKLEELANGLMANGKLKTSKPSTSAASSSAPNPWNAAMSVEAAAAQAKKKPKGIAHPPPKLLDSDDSDEDEPLKFKSKANGTGPKKTIKKKDKEAPKEKKFKKVTAYNVFVGKESTRLRELCKEQGCPVVTNEDKKELMGKVSALWGALKDEDKVAWQELADERNAVRLAVFEGRAPPASSTAAASDPVALSDVDGHESED